MDTDTRYTRAGNGTAFAAIIQYFPNE